ncbi:amino acid ABC transporter permease [Bordetella genomosp. 10]|uniref:amino acid ABC transporter permease n=1 Tax=Bordetella genomosp. 10 TaxID=1416804 RepID=UPI000B9E90D5|nr:amino acid ABC transporter permease [Bordetella genomosp. 10]
MSGLDFSIVFSNLHYLIVEGLGLTLQLTVVCACTGLAIGTLLALIRLFGPGWAGLIVSLWVSLCRSIPLILVVFWVYFLSPYVLAWMTNADAPVQISAVKSAFVTFTLFEACYYCEIVRAGILAVPRAQSAAARALGLSEIQVLIKVVIPQAFRSVAPILILQAIVLFQDVSLVYVLSLTDFLGAATQLGQQQNRLVETYLFVAIVYFLICLVSTRGVHRLPKHLSHA